LAQKVNFQRHERIDSPPSRVAGIQQALHLPSPLTISGKPETAPDEKTGKTKILDFQQSAEP
jgi:hypothetical protein